MFSKDNITIESEKSSSDSKIIIFPSNYTPIFKREIDCLKSAVNSALNRFETIKDATGLDAVLNALSPVYEKIAK